jgi:PAS domain S-box-containing protein
MEAEGEKLFTVILRDITQRERAEEALQRIAAIVEFSEDAIITKDLNGVITTWNPGAERLFGYTAREAIGQPITLIIPADRLEEEPAVLARIRSGGSVRHYETVRRRKDGTLLDISLSVSPLKNSQGQMTGASKIARDISGRKRTEAALRASEQHFRALGENIAQLAWIADASGSVFWYNQRWYD